MHIWSGESSDYTAELLSMSVAAMEEETVGVSVRLNQAVREWFPKHHHV